MHLGLHKRALDSLTKLRNSFKLRVVRLVCTIRIVYSQSLLLIRLCKTTALSSRNALEQQGNQEGKTETLDDKNVIMHVC